MGKRPGGAVEESPRVLERRERLVALCRSLPGAEVEQAGAQHLALKVAKKIFGYYLYDHHGDGRVALCCKAPPGEQALLVEENPRQYFVPPYVGKKGWVALRLDLPRVDWTAVRSLLFGAYFMTAPKRLSLKLGSGRRE
jgi:hypothetical protein